MESIRCLCNRLLAKAEGFDIIEIKCPRCGTLVRHQKASPSLSPARPPSAQIKDEHRD